MQFILQHELIHIRYTERELIDVGSILVSLYGSEHFLLGEEQF